MQEVQVERRMLHVEISIKLIAPTPLPVLEQLLASHSLMVHEVRFLKTNAPAPSPEEEQLEKVVALRVHELMLVTLRHALSEGEVEAEVQ